MLQLPKNQPIQQETVQEGQAKKRQRGTGFTGLQKVLSANVGAGQKMGQAIGDQLGQQAEQVRKGIEQGQAKFQAGLEKEQQKRQQTIGAVTGAIGDIQKNLGQAPKDFYSVPENDTSSPNLGYADIGQNLRNLEYLGPKSVENIQEQQQKAVNLAALGRLSGMAGGQQQLLRSQVAGKGRYGLGQSSLDALLLGKEGQRQLQVARSQTGGVETQAQQAEKMAQTEAQTAESSTEAAKMAAMQKLQQETQGLLDLGSEQAQQYYTTGKYAQDALRKISEAKDPRSFQLSEEEKRALLQGGNVGLDLNINFDARNPELLKQILNRTATAGATTYAGGQIFSPEQKIALKNLDLLQKGKQIDRKEAERDLFGDVSKESEKLLSDYYDQMINKAPNIYNEKLLGDLMIKYKPEVFRSYTNTAGGDQAIRDVISKPEGKGGYGGEKYFRRLMDWYGGSPETWQKDRGGTTISAGMFNPVLNIYKDKMKEIEKGYQAQNKATVQDYIDKILGKK